MDRKRRFEYTLRHCIRAKRVWFRSRFWSWDSPEDKADNRSYPLGHFRKSSGAGCRGSKKGSRHSPKFGSCCKSGFNYRRTVQDRIEARRICKAWTEWVQLHDGDDFNDAAYFDSQDY